MLTVPRSLFPKEAFKMAIIIKNLVNNGFWMNWKEEKRCFLNSAFAFASFFSLFFSLSILLFISCIWNSNCFPFLLRPAEATLLGCFTFLFFSGGWRRWWDRGGVCGNDVITLQLMSQVKSSKTNFRGWKVFQPHKQGVRWHHHQTHPLLPSRYFRYLLLALHRFAFSRYSKHFSRSRPRPPRKRIEIEEFPHQISITGSRAPLNHQDIQFRKYHV